MDPIMQQMAAVVFGGAATQQQPQTVVNVGAQTPAPLGDYAAEIAQEEEERMRSYMGESVELWDGSFSPDLSLGDVSLPQRVYSANPQLGGLLDDVNRMVTGATGRVIGNLGGATKTALEKIAKSVDSLAKAHNATRRTTASNRSMIHRHARILDAHFGDKTKWQRLILNTLVSLPGVRASKVLAAAPNVSILKALAQLGDVADDEYTGDVTETPFSVVPAVPAADTYTTAGMDAVTDALQANDAALRARLAEVEERLDDVLKAFAEHKIKGAAETMQGYVTEDIFVQLGSLAPSQLVDREEALYESAAKYLFGRPRSAGAPLISF